ncbi:MAG: hypothetical protein U0104_05415 [Gemmatimonadales bacterium]
MRLTLVVLLGAALAWFTYARLERLGRRAWPAVLGRSVAWAALGILLLDLTCAAPPAARTPLVLLDGSLSMTAAGGRWAEARDSARAWGEVRRFGDAVAGAESLPAFGRSDLEPALRAAAASDRPVLVVTDGEITDAGDLPPELVARAGVRTFPRRPSPDVAIGRVAGPLRATAGDTVRLDVEVRTTGRASDSVRVEVRLGGRVLARRGLRPGADAATTVTLPVPTPGLSGDAVLDIALAGAGDAEPRDDARRYVLRVSPTPGVVLLASPPDWDSRFLFQALRDVAELPIRGYARLDNGPWRAMATLQPVSPEEVQQAARHADVLVVKGRVPDLARGATPRGRWLWPSGEGGETVVPGEWYAMAAPASPVAPAFVGLPVDSFPPLVSVTPIEPAPEDWVGLTAQLARRGADRPVFTGQVRGTRREVLTAADGFWRWAFRGGSGEQAYRGLVAGTLSWLLGAADSAGGRARLMRPVVSNGRPVVFEWAGTGTPVPTGITLVSEAATRRDTLAFDGAGRGELRLPPGTYAYELDGGGRGTLVVDTWSEEWFPAAPRLPDRPVPPLALDTETSARRFVWLFGLVLAGLSVEWLARRRLGLR